jgi:hypothetical protein
VVDLDSSIVIIILTAKGGDQQIGFIFKNPTICCLQELHFRQVKSKKKKLYHTNIIKYLTKRKIKAVMLISDKVGLRTILLGIKRDII